MPKMSNDEMFETIKNFIIDDVLQDYPGHDLIHQIVLNTLGWSDEKYIDVLSRQDHTDPEYGLYFSTQSNVRYEVLARCLTTIRAYPDPQ